MPELQDIKAEFESISSEASRASFTNKLGLIRAEGPGQTATYNGSHWGLLIEVRERWWDPSSVYTLQVDEHEIALFIGGKVITTVRFSGAS